MDSIYGLRMNGRTDDGRIDGWMDGWVVDGRTGQTRTDSHVPGNETNGLMDGW